MKNLFAWTGRFVVGGLAAFGAFAVYAFLTATPDKPDKPDMPSMALSFALNTQVLSNDYGMSCFWIAGQDWTYIDPPPEEKMDHGV